MPWENQSHPGQIDTIYYMGGEIHYPDGHKETVLFGCCKDPKGKCYHRRFQSKEKNAALFTEFETSQFEYKFPKYFKKATGQEKIIDINLNNIHYSKSCFETPFYVELYDEINKVTIILFKPKFSL